MKKSEIEPTDPYFQQDPYFQEEFPTPEQIQQVEEFYLYVVKRNK